MNTQLDRRPLITAGVLLGTGMGGFIDGIVLHQLLQVHHMVSAIYPPDTVRNMIINTFWDGVFHMVAWLLLAAGIAMLWKCGARKDVPWNGRILSGAMIMGWGIFNFAEGIIDHHVLHLHHVVEEIGLSWADHAFLGSGIALILVGWWMIRTARDTEPARHTTSLS